jgi:hypothetical protein
MKRREAENNRRNSGFTVFCYGSTHWERYKIE